MTGVLWYWHIYLSLCGYAQGPDPRTAERCGEEQFTCRATNPCQIKIMRLGGERKGAIACQIGEKVDYGNRRSRHIVFNSPASLFFPKIKAPSAMKKVSLLPNL